MVKCACGREFKNMGKLNRHLALHAEGSAYQVINKKDAPLHIPDMEHDATVKARLRYIKSHKGRRVNHGD